MKKFSFLGYEIGGWGALIGLAGTAVAVWFAVSQWLNEKPMLDFLAPSHVEFWCQNYSQLEGDWMCPDEAGMFVNSPVILVHGGQRDYDYVITKMLLSVSVVDRAGKSVWYGEFDWHSISSGSVRPLIVPKGSATSEEVSFRPALVRDNKRNLVADAGTFDSFVEAAGSPNATEIALKFTASLQGGEPAEVVQSSCAVEIEPKFKENAAIKGFVLYSRPCS